MSDIHHRPDLHGVRFGSVTLTVDPGRGDCVLRVPVPGPAGTVDRALRFHGADEIEGALAAQAARAGRDKVSRDMAAALRFAAARLARKAGTR